MKTPHVDALRPMHSGLKRARTVQTFKGPVELPAGYSTRKPRAVREYLSENGLSLAWEMLALADRVAELEADSKPDERIEALKASLATAQDRATELAADRAMSRSHVVYTTLLDAVKAGDDELATLRKEHAELVEFQRATVIRYGVSCSDGSRFLALETTRQEDPDEDDR